MLQDNTNKGLLVVAGHAIYQRRRWYGGFPNEDRFYEQHVRDSVAIWQDEKYTSLVFSGGHTRPQLEEVQNGTVTNSEAEGLLEFAKDANLCSEESDVILESYARDSFENFLFSIFAFYHKYRVWPSRLGIVSWKFKALRFYVIACGLQLGNGRFVFYGSGDPNLQKTLEIVCAANAKYDATIVSVHGKPTIFDPLHRDDMQFALKRLGRMPPRFKTNKEYIQEVKRVYDPDFDDSKQGIIGDILDYIENIKPSTNWRTARWPW